MSLVIIVIQLKKKEKKTQHERKRLENVNENVLGPLTYFEKIFPSCFFLFHLDLGEVKDLHKFIVALYSRRLHARNQISNESENIESESFRLRKYDEKYKKKNTSNIL